VNGYQAETTIRWRGNGKPEIVCLCGSTRFKDAILATAARLSLEGAIVVGPFVFGHVDLPEADWSTGGTDVKRMLDDLHFRKIDLCDRVYVVNPGDYIGESTRNEITYAVAIGRRVDFLAEPADWRGGVL
jgi:hypothetical protein